MNLASKAYEKPIEIQKKSMTKDFDAQNTPA